MSSGLEARAFLRLVVTLSVVANTLAALTIGGERFWLRPYVVDSSLDRYRLVLSDELESYSTSVQSLLDRSREADQP